MKFICSFLLLIVSINLYSQKRITDVNSTKTTVYSYTDKNDGEVYIIDITSLGKVTIRIIDSEGQPQLYKTKDFNLKSRITRFYKRSGIVLMFYKEKIIKYHYKSGKAFEIDLPQNFILGQYIDASYIMDDGILAKAKDNSTSNNFWQFIKNDGSIQHLENEIFLIKSNNQYALFKVGDRIKVFDLTTGKKSEISVFGINTTVHSILSNNKFYFINQDFGISVIDLSDTILKETILDLPPLIGNHITFFESTDQVMVTGLNSTNTFYGYILEEQSLNVIKDFSFDIKVPLNPGYKTYYNDSMFYMENLGTVYLYNTNTKSLKIIESANKEHDFSFLENGYIIIDSSGFIECYIPEVDSTYEVNLPNDHKHLSSPIGHSDLVVGACFNSDFEKTYYSSKFKKGTSFIFKPNYDFNEGLYNFGMRLLSVGNDLLLTSKDKLYAIFEDSYVLVEKDIASVRVDNEVLYCIKRNDAFIELYKYQNSQLSLILTLHETFDIASFKELKHGIVFYDFKQNAYYYNFEQDQITLLSELISAPSFDNSIHSQGGNVLSWQANLFNISDQGEFKRYSNLGCNNCSGLKLENAHYIVNQYSNNPIYRLVNGEFEESPLNDIFEIGGNVGGIRNLGNRLLINYYVNDATSVYQLDSNGLNLLTSFSEIQYMSFQNEDFLVYNNLGIGYVFRTKDMIKIKVDDFTGTILDIYENGDHIFMLMLNYEASIYDVSLIKFSTDFKEREVLYNASYKSSIYRNKHFFNIDSLYVILEDKMYNVNNLSINKIQDVILLNTSDGFVEHKGLHYYIGFEDPTGYQIYLYEGDKVLKNKGLTNVEAQKLSTYPNPTSNSFRLKMDNAKGPYKYEIYNTIGMLSQKGYVSPNTDINVQQLLPGIYYLIIHVEGNAKSVKFIKI